MMHLDHAAIRTNQLEKLKNYYCAFFGGSAGKLYFNPNRQFHSYFISFGEGARLEIMSWPGMPEEPSGSLDQHGIVHLAFGVESMAEVDEKAAEILAAGFNILSGPRRTGDGCYEFETLDPDGNNVEVTTPFTEG